MNVKVLCVCQLFIKLVMIMVLEAGNWAVFIFGRKNLSRTT